MARAAALLQWSDLLESPKTALTVLATHPTVAVEPDALAGGFEKLAHTDSAGALNLLPMLLARDGLTPALQARLGRAAALGAAYDHDPRAIAAFDGLAPDAVDSQVEEWHARAALWMGDYGGGGNQNKRNAARLSTQPPFRDTRARPRGGVS